MPTPLRIAVALFVCSLLASPTDTVPSDVRSALDRIEASELKGDLSFLASDTLQGRYTPSPGLDVAAEFIASKFRAAGLEPGGNNSFFQVAELVERLPATASSLTAKADGDTLTVPPGSLSVTSSSAAAKIEDAPVLTFAARNPDLLKGTDLTGKAIVVPAVDLMAVPADQRREAVLAMRAFDQAVAGSKAAIEVVVTSNKPPPANTRLLFADGAMAAQVPLITVESQQLVDWLKSDKTLRSISVELSAPADHKVFAKNVIGILRGSDPQLKETCVMVTAHYDHLGTTATAGRAAMSGAQGDDNIFNGANDDGSGTVSVIELARALSHLNPHPKRSIVFMTFFGEERGEYGSRYYGLHPVFPLARTVADVNLEQIGRTDSTTGKQIKTASLTGYDYSDVTAYLEKAGKQMGVKVYKDPEASDAYFTRSDNDALAEQGVPAHSLTVAFNFPDYHRVGDEWQKIDYENMAAVDRMVGLALVDIANNRKPPAWNADNPKTEPFRQAQSKQSKQ